MTEVNEESPRRSWIRRTRWPLSLLAFLIFCVLLGIAGIPLLTAQKWVGVKARCLQFELLDATSGAPVANAEVCLFRGYVENPGWTAEPDMADAETHCAVTGADGRTRLSYEFRATGTSYFYFEAGTTDFGDRFVRVTADGYKSEVFRLAKRIGESRDIGDERPITIVVPMKR
jgi:hypothetical protein